MISNVINIYSSINVQTFYYIKIKMPWIKLFTSTEILIQISNDFNYYLYYIYEFIYIYLNLFG